MLDRCASPVCTEHLGNGKQASKATELSWWHCTRKNSKTHSKDSLPYCLSSFRARASASPRTLSSSPRPPTSVQASPSDSPRGPGALQVSKSHGAPSQVSEPLCDRLCPSKPDAS